MNDELFRRTYSRNESEADRLDRNYAEMLQELRVAQTGVQILFAFLLSIAFQQRFNDIDAFQLTVYVITLLCAAVSALLLIAPVPAHRVLFRQHRKDELVTFTGRVCRRRPDLSDVGDAGGGALRDRLGCELAARTRQRGRVGCDRGLVLVDPANSVGSP
mgnify:CR=1 FL=1